VKLAWWTAMMMAVAGPLHGGTVMESLLSQCCGLVPADIARLDKGEPLARLVKEGSADDLTLMGAIRLKISRAAYLKWYGNLENFKKSSMIENVGRFHNPPRPEDVAQLQVFRADARKLKGCRPGTCAVKLTVAEQECLETVDWTAPNLPERVNAMARESIRSDVANYLKQGDAALGNYVDRQPPTSIVETFRSLVNGSVGLRRAFPKVFEKIASYQGGLGEGESVYWDTESYGLGSKPLLNVIHVMRFEPQTGVSVICSKQIRATHYYDGSLGFTILVDANPGTYLVYVNRSRIDLLRGGGWKKSLLEHYGPGMTKKEMVRLKSRVESQ
jgi:hypothetical protein